MSLELKSQLIELFFQAIFWRIFIKYVGVPIVRKYVSSKPWRSQWVTFNGNSMRNLGINLDRAETFGISCEIVAIMGQHATSALLCLPSVLGIPGWGFLATHGALCEAGWELQDALVRGWDVMFGGEAGRKRNPPGVILYATCHHLMGLLVVVPANLLHGDDPLYHQGIFWFEAGTVCAIMSQQYGYTLDVKGSFKDLFMMNVLVVTSFGVQVYW